MAKRLDIKGKRFHRLLVISDAIVKKQQSYWDCVCDCGNKTQVKGCQLTNGQTRSCGCYQKEQTSKAQFKHGMSNSSPEWYSWVNMKTRCYNPNSEDYKDYGGRGIIVCERWRTNFELFLLDMGKRPASSHSIDRINTNGNYTPENCRWATKEQQARNKRTNRWIEYNGLKMILQDWALYFGVNQGNLINSIKSKGIERVYQFYLEKHKGILPVNPDVLLQYVKNETDIK